MQSGTEQASASFNGLDTWLDERILAALIDGQARAVDAVRVVLPAIASAASAIAARLKAGGRLFYAGAGTSIRVGVQDGSELPATFGMAEDRIGYLIAGGRAAMFETLADAEDDADQAARDAGAAKIKDGDIVIAIAASGTTPYTVAATRAAKAAGALIIAVVNNQGSPLGAIADHEIAAVSGPEVIAGSTRMGAGTAQKAALNLLSTLSHIKLGAVHDGMMVNVEAGNAKLKARAARIVSAIAGVDIERAATALADAGGAVKPAVLLCAGANTLESAKALLGETGGNLRLALGRLSAPS